MEIGKALTVESAYTAEDLSQAIQAVKEKAAEAETRLAELKEEEARKKQGIDMITPAYNQFKSWAEEFDGASLEPR